MTVSIKRIYDEPSKKDGYRILVDQLWPRGISKERGALNEWLKEIAPTPDLRTWFGHKPERFTEFSTRYEAELEKNPVTSQLEEICKKHHTVTLLYAARDPVVNHAHILSDYLKHR